MNKEHMEDSKKKVMCIDADKNGNRNYYFIFLFVTAAFFFLMHLTFASFTNDEIYFIEYKKGFSGLLDVIIDRYKTDSSRVISEALLFTFLDMPFIVWQVLDSLMCVLIYQSLCVILINDKNSKMNMLVFMAFASYPFMHVGSAGWICTSLNYLWPLATLLYALTGVYKRVRGEKIYAGQYILYFIALIYTANTEMSATVLTILAIPALYYAYKEKRSKKYEIACLIMGLAGLVFAFTAPGNGARTAMEAANWMPEFPDLSLFEKFRLCSVFVFQHFVEIPDIIFIMFGVIIAIFGYRESKKLSEKIICEIPVIITIIYTVLYGIEYVKNVLEKYNAGQGLQIKYDFKIPSVYPEAGFETALQYVELISLYVYIVAAVIAIFIIIKDTKTKVVTIWALGAGFAVRMALMLSPTMFSSWHRTLIFMYFAYIFAILAMIKDRGIKAVWTKILIYGILICGILVNLILTVGLQIRKG